MKNVASMFTEEARAALEASLGVVLTDDRDYTEDELEDLYILITDDFPSEYDPDGEPLRMGQIFEDILDVFFRRKLVTFDD